MLILNLDFKIPYKYILKKKGLSVLFWLIFVGALSKDASCHGNKGRYISNFGIKRSPNISRKNHKVSRKNISSFWSYAPKTMEEGEEQKAFAYQR